MFFNPTLSDFSSDESFLSLQNKFLNLDERNNDIYVNNTEIKKEDFFIVYKTNDGKYPQLYFHAVLISKIKNLGRGEIQSILKRINSDFFFNKEVRKNFINHTIQHYLNIYAFLNDCNFIPQDTKEIIFEEIKIVLEFLYDDEILKNQFEENQKMKIKVNKNDIHTFFMLLRQANLIDYRYEADLGRLIDNFFQFYDSKNDVYKNISNSNKEIGGFKNSTKTHAKSISRIKELFMNEKFYELK